MDVFVICFIVYIFHGMQYHSFANMLELKNSSPAIFLLSAEKLK